MDEYFTLIASRESCRKFADKPVEREKIERMLEAARIAPSACNGQPWHYTAVLKPELAREVADCVQGAGMNKFAQRCPAFIVVEEMPTSLTSSLGGMVKNQSYAPIDVGLSAMQLCLAATAQGLSTCIMGWFSESRLKKLLKLEAASRVRLVVAVGYAQEGVALREKQRKPMEKVARIIE